MSARQYKESIDVLAHLVEFKEKFLLEQSDPNQLAFGGWGSLHFACVKNDWEITTWLVLHRGADPNYLTDDYRNNALFFTGDRRIRAFLLWQGCDPEHMNKNKYYSVNFCHRYLYMKIIRILLHSSTTAIHKDLWREVAEWFLMVDPRPG